MRLIDADRLLSAEMKSKYYHLPNGDIAIPIIDIEHAPTVGGWVSVKDQSPKPPEDKPSILQRWYLVALENGNVTLSAYDFTSKQWRGFTGVPVTHWMPLPERPKE